MVSGVPSNIRKKIRAVVRRLQNEYGGDCLEMSEKVQEELWEIGVGTALVDGWFRVNKDDVGISHTWIVLPEFENAIIDPTSSQFGDQFPEIWFPANPKHYEPEIIWNRPHGMPDIRFKSSTTFIKGRTQTGRTQCPVRVRSYRRRSLK